MAPRAVAWAIRAFFFTVVGVLTFVIQPPGATAENAQLVAYVLAGLGLLAWALADMWPAAARYRARALPVTLGVIAVAGGFACTAGSNENNCPVMLASMATTAAGTEIGLGTGWLVTAASVVAIDANWLIYRDGSAQLSSFLLFPLLPLTGLLFGRVLYGRRADPAAARPDRLRLPGVQLGPDADRGREHRPAHRPRGPQGRPGVARIPGETAGYRRPAQPPAR
jgi:hypothetical protein